MNADSTSLAKSYFEPLIAGDRNACRQVVDQALNVGITPYDLLTQLVWSTMELLQELYREDRITISQLNMATRLNRTLTDQICARLARSEAVSQKNSAPTSNPPSGVWRQETTRRRVERLSRSDAITIQ